MSMSNMIIDGLLVSKNAKTGCSINVDRCKPTPWCAAHCYRKFRSAQSIKAAGLSSTPNNGPITWEKQQAAYKRNDAALKALDESGQLEATVSKLAVRLKVSGIKHLRGNGTGDLFPELIVFYALCALKSIKIFMFSRIPEKIVELSELCSAMGVPLQDRPFVLGSVDPSTPQKDVDALIAATKEMNGKPALAYATDTKGEAGCDEVDKHPASQHFNVVFGYHTNHLHTVLGHKKECPATAGKAIKCDQCRKCYGFAEARK